MSPTYIDFLPPYGDVLGKLTLIGAVAVRLPELGGPLGLPEFGGLGFKLGLPVGIPGFYVPGTGCSQILLW